MSRPTQQRTPDARGIGAERQLESLRADLDRLDDRLLDIVRDRIELCTRIALVKRAHAIPMLQPGRMAAVHEHAEHYAREHHLSPEFLDELYRLVIDEACRVEDEVIAGQDGARRTGPPGPLDAERRRGAR
ncbi:chorismate mutase family protein [Rhodococcus sp. D2-41]|uniref:Chorismate mutase n=1 Tax=Speluncibacter jeojiensis TaxID=2710754 RepID=A0A9X4M4G8_9ACTN|nr:chorismate mutase family protein [Rhodococcus sp. D2-41]MDG3010646.1 chorismate mutase family protein [Rhodococcus sp. D2-41]MDG3016825.1 chorismate mutase [Corynebacteriales bacterium D3-21]